MDIRKEVEEFEKLQDTEIMNAMVVNVLMNNYTLENVAFGKLKPNDKIPFDRFVEDLNLQKHKPYLYRDCIEGNYITKDERVSQKGEDDFIIDCLLFHIQNVFTAYPKSNVAFGGINGLIKFIVSLYPLFIKIIKTEVEVEPQTFAPVFKDRKEEAVCYNNISKFLIAVKAKGLRQGGCVDRYVKHLPYIPYYVQRLLKTNKNRYLLANSDTDSLEYKLAILSAIHFMNFEHTKLFELKTQKCINSY